VRSSAGRLSRSFYARSPLEVAPDLLGQVLVREAPGEPRLSVRIVETEAYREDDPASHSYGRRTPRNAVMFGPAGRLYVYFTYGMHFCMNVVTGQDGEGSAVLLRAAAPLEGLEEMALRRGTSDPRRLCSGPAMLCQALGVGRTDNGIDLAGGAGLWVEAGEQVPRARIGRSARVGIRQGVERRWRFFVRDDPFVSRARPAAPIKD